MLEIKRRLGQVATVRNVTLVLLSQRHVRVRVSYVGDPKQLQTAFDQVNLTLRQTPKGWKLAPMFNPSLSVQ